MRHSAISTRFNVFLGNGDGTFSTHIDTTFGDGILFAGMAVGDFNRDGKLDVAIVDQNASVLVFFGNGDGSFQPPKTVATGVFNASSISTADLNIDGNLDLIILRLPGNGADIGSVSVLLGNGDGTFQPSVVSSTGNNPFAPAIGDLNGDGKLDLAVDDGNHSSALSILLGNGNGTFQSPVLYANGVPGNSVALGDFNRDGTMDLAILDPGSQSSPDLSVFLQGTFPALGVSPTSLTFGQQALGTTSPPQTITLTNTGTATLTLSSIAVTGPNAGDYAESNTCSSSLSTGATCQISVTFKPTEGGSLQAAVSINDNSLVSLQVVPLSAMIPDFSLSANTSTTATVNAGQSAVYGINVTPVDGFNQTVTFSCSGAPAESTCTVVPGQVKLDGANTATATVNVSTTPHSMAVGLPNGVFRSLAKYQPTVLFLTLSVMTAVACFVGWRCVRYRRLWYKLALLLLVSAAMTTILSCGGGGSSSVISERQAQTTRPPDQKKRIAGLNRARTQHSAKTSAGATNRTAYNSTLKRNAGNIQAWI